MSSPGQSDDTSDQNLREFYEMLTLLRILGPCIGPRVGALRTVTPTCDHSFTPLRRFLDRISWLCDYKTGGDTVSSVALEETASGAKFWLATSYKHGEAVQNHLSSLLVQLSGAHSLSAGDSYKLEQDITSKCIIFAHERVKTYAKLLVCLFEQCREVLEDSDVQLARDLSHLTKLESHSELCAKADLFRDSESLRLLSRRVSSVTSPSIWSMLRHYIGRLGSWHRASRTIVLYASTRPQMFVDRQVGLLKTPKPIFVPRADESTRLDSVLSRLFAVQERLQLERGIQAMQRVRKVDLDSLFRKEYCDKNFKPRVHAEVWMLEHFCLNDLQFLDGDRYIGCSKPSCYCCDSYILNRTSGSIERPSHGNVWTNWQSPLHQDSSKQSLNNSIRSAMVSKFKNDLKDLINGPGETCAKVPDSTSGYTPSGV